MGAANSSETDPLLINPSLNTDDDSDILQVVPDRENTVEKQRLKYYNSLKIKSNLDFDVPPNYIPSELFVRDPLREMSGRWGPRTVKGETPGMEPTPDYSQSSFVTVFSIANTMLGSSLLAIPWGFTQSGFGTGMGVVLFVGIVCLYTAYLVVRNGGGYDDFSVQCKECFGQYAYVISIVCSVLILVGAGIAYDTIMSNSLFR